MKTIGFVKELFTARYDSDDNMIIGCKEGGIVWQHEARHKEQFNNSIFKKFYYGSLFFFQIGGLAFLYITFTEPLGFAGVGLVGTPHLIMVLLSEIDAWIVAFCRKYKGDLT